MSNQATLRPAPSMSEIKRLCSDLCASLKGSQRAGAELTTINTLSAALSQFPCGRPTTFALVILRQHLSKLYATDSSEVAFQIAACLLMEASRGIVACTDLVSLDASKERQNTEPDAVKAAKEWNACMRIILVGLHEYVWDDTRKDYTNKNAQYRTTMLEFVGQALLDLIAASHVKHVDCNRYIAYDLVSELLSKHAHNKDILRKTDLTSTLAHVLHDSADRHVSYSAIELAFRLCPLAQQQEEREAFLMRLFPDSLFVNAAPQARARFASMKAVEVPNKGQQLLDFLALDDLSRAQRFTGRIQFGDEEAATVATSSRSQKSKIPFYLGRDGIQAVILARAPLLMSFEEEEHEEARLSIAFDSIVKTSLHDNFWAIDCREHPMLMEQSLALPLSNGLIRVVFRLEPGQTDRLRRILQDRASSSLPALQPSATVDAFDATVTRDPRRRPIRRVSESVEPVASFRQVKKTVPESDAIPERRSSEDGARRAKEAKTRAAQMAKQACLSELSSDGVHSRQVSKSSNLPSPLVDAVQVTTVADLAKRTPPQATALERKESELSSVDSRYLSHDEEDVNVTGRGESLPVAKPKPAKKSVAYGKRVRTSDASKEAVRSKDKGVSDEETDYDEPPADHDTSKKGSRKPAVGKKAPVKSKATKAVSQQVTDQTSKSSAKPMRAAKATAQRKMNAELAHEVDDKDDRSEVSDAAHNNDKTKKGKSGKSGDPKKASAESDTASSKKSKKRQPAKQKIKKRPLDFVDEAEASLHAVDGPDKKKQKRADVDFGKYVVPEAPEKLVDEPGENGKYVTSSDGELPSSNEQEEGDERKNAITSMSQYIPSIHMPEEKRLTARDRLYAKAMSSPTAVFGPTAVSAHDATNAEQDDEEKQKSVEEERGGLDDTAFDKRDSPVPRPSDLADHDSALGTDLDHVPAVEGEGAVHIIEQVDTDMQAFVPDQANEREADDMSSRTDAGSSPNLFSPTTVGIDEQQSGSPDLPGGISFSSTKASTAVPKKQDQGQPEREDETTFTSRVRSTTSRIDAFRPEWIDGPRKGTRYNRPSESPSPKKQQKPKQKQDVPSDKEDTNKGTKKKNKKRVSIVSPLPPPRRRLRPESPIHRESGSTSNTTGDVATELLFTLSSAFVVRMQETLRREEERVECLIRKVERKTIDKPTEQRALVSKEMIGSTKAMSDQASVAIKALSELRTKLVLPPVVF